MVKGLQTHFNAPVDAGLLRELLARGVQMCRMDCQHVDGAPLTQMVEDAFATGLAPLVVLDNERQLSCLPANVGIHAELLNEPDIARMPTDEYRTRLAVFADTALARGIIPCGPVISNLVPRGFNYLRAVSPMPASVLLSVHRYTPGTHWTDSHTTSREDEVKTLRALGGADRPYGVSEFGYNSHDQSDEQARDNIAHEFALWAQEGAVYACLYQLNDGVENTVMNRYGVRRPDGTWKPQMDAFLQQVTL